jgi:tetratricopeptide (TPR) repeat protein
LIGSAKEVEVKSRKSPGNRLSRDSKGTGRSIQASDDFADIFECGSLEPGSGAVLGIQAYLARSLGQPEEAIALCKQAIALDPLRANLHLYQIAEIYAYRGETNKAFHWLDRAIQQRDPGAPEVQTDPLMRNVRQDPRYTEVLKKIRMPI